MATSDWETTCLIYGEEDESTSTFLNGERLERGSIDLTVSTAGPVYCRRLKNLDAHLDDKYRFWMLEEELVFHLVFFAESNDDVYQSVEIRFASSYPDSFPPKSREAWLQWMEAKVCDILQREQVSYAVCMFVQEGAFDFFPTLYHDEERHLILFPDADTGNYYYQDSTIVATLGEPTHHLTASHDEEPRDLVFERHDVNGSISQQELSPMQAKHIFPLLVLWRDWLPVHCKICFDTVPATDAATITCGHAFCRDCLVTYVSHKAQEIKTYNTNPFVCPTCRRGMLIVGCVKQFLPPDLMDKVRDWYKDLKHPLCYSLPTCLKKDCQGVMRRVAVDNDIVYCDRCGGKWCELCLRRAREEEEHTTNCNVGVCVEFCKRYLAADAESQEHCEAKWPWIKIYAKSRVHDDAVTQWVQSNAQVCPGCKTGIERSEGCFHIKCHCGTHFCYHCGEEIFAPFYGTHHCWERGES